MALTAKKVYAILKRQISDMEAKLNSPVRYRGTVATADLLPLNPDIGDMYNIESKSIYGEAGMNVAWNGVVWDTMGAPIDMSLYFTKEEAEAVIQRLVTEYFEKNPVKPGATTEQAQQIEQNKTDIASLKTETSSLKEDIVDVSDAMTLITSDNLFDESKQTTGYQYYSDGTIHKNDIMAISDFIEVDNSRELFFGKKNQDGSVDHTYVANVIEFSEKKTYIKGTSDVTNIATGENTKYIRFSRNLRNQPYGLILSYDDYAKKFVPYERYYACVDKKTTRYNAKYYGVLTTNSSTDNFDALMRLMEHVSSLGGGVIYIPAGTYNLSNARNKRFSFNNITVVGDGCSTRLVRWNIYPIINICGTSKNTGGEHCNNITFRDISFVSSQMYKNTMKAIMIFECVSYLRIDSCDFNGNGSHIEMREVYDSKIISTDFTNSGRKYKESDVNDAVFDVNNITYNDLQNTAPTLIFASNGAETYNPDIENTNQVLFWGCRIESFTDGAVGVVGTGTNMLRFTDCKFESILSTTPFVMVCGTFVASTFEDCVFYRPTILFGRDDRMLVDTVPIFFLNSGMDISRNKITGNLSLYYNGEDIEQMKVPLVMCGKKTQNNIIELFFKPTNDNGIKYLKDGVNVVSEESENNIINII